MTQSLLNKGMEGNNPSDDFNANPKWICAEDFKPRPKNVSGVSRMELARYKESGEQFLVVYNTETKTFHDRCSCEEIPAGSLEIRIVEIR